jgi:alpha-ketoglutarate-dependent taurine dioxygenase
MKIKPLNNCGVEITDIDISNLTEADYQEIREIFLQELIIVIRNQDIKTVPHAKLIHKLGFIANFNQTVWNTEGNLSQYFTGKYIDPFTYEGVDGEFPVQRVTGKKVNGLISGINGYGILDWHSNMNGPMNRARGVSLQGMSAAVVGTSTSWMDTTLAYEALSPELKTRCDGVVGKYKYSPEIWAEGIPEEQMKLMLANNEDFYLMPLINVSRRGKIGLYFHYLNQCSFPSDPELLEILKVHCFQDKFIYKHEWQPGDIVISDQVLTLHRRDTNDQQVLLERILHRYTFNY